MSIGQKTIFLMNLDKFSPKNEPEDLLLAVTKNCETQSKQTHTKPQKALAKNCSKILKHF